MKHLETQKLFKVKHLNINPDLKDILVLVNKVPDQFLPTAE